MTGDINGDVIGGARHPALHTPGGLRGPVALNAAAAAPPPCGAATSATASRRSAGPERGCGALEWRRSRRGGEWAASQAWTAFMAQSKAARLLGRRFLINDSGQAERTEMQKSLGTDLKNLPLNRRIRSIKGSNCRNQPSIVEEIQLIYGCLLCSDTRLFLQFIFNPIWSRNKK